MNTSLHPRLQLGLFVPKYTHFYGKLISQLDLITVHFSSSVFAELHTECRSSSTISLAFHYSCVPNLGSHHYTFYRNIEFNYSSRSEVTYRVVFGLITWFASLGKSSREFVYIFFFKVYVHGHVTYPPRYGVHQVLSY